jgi:hypothetical protein
MRFTFTSKFLSSCFSGFKIENDGIQERIVDWGEGMNVEMFWSDSHVFAYLSSLPLFLISRTLFLA